MKTMLSILFTLAAGVAQAHWSVVAHEHPHGVSLLPDLGSFIVGGIFVIALAMVAYAKFGQR
jgi:hypothetical protein